MSNLLAALCIPFLMSCGDAQEPVATISPATNSVAPEQRVVSQQAPIQKRIDDNMAAWCEREMRYLEQEMNSEAGQEKKYRKYLKLKMKGIKRECRNK